MSTVPDPVPEPPSPSPIPPPPPAVVIPRGRWFVSCVSAFKERSDDEAWQFAFGSYLVIWVEISTGPTAEGPMATFRSPIILHPLSGLLVSQDEMQAQFPANVYFLVHATWPRADDGWQLNEIKESLKPAAVEAALAQRSKSLARLAEARELLAGQRTRLTREPPSLPARPRCGADELEVEPPPEAEPASPDPPSP